jgi:hypothetical protein
MEKVNNKILQRVMGKVRAASRATNSKNKIVPGNIFPMYFDELRNC